MNVAAMHQQMVRHVFLHVELLLNSGVPELSEYDVQGMMFLAFRSALANTGWRANREVSGKVDCVVLEGKAPRVLYEIKTYFKPRERFRVIDFQTDLKKLQASLVKYPDARAFFFVAARKAKLKQTAVVGVPALNDLVHPTNGKWKSFTLANGTRVRLRPSRNEQYGRSVVLTWEVK